MTLGENDKPFIITDGVLNVLPKLEKPNAHTKKFSRVCK